MRGAGGRQGLGAGEKECCRAWGGAAAMGCVVGVYRVWIQNVLLGYIQRTAAQTQWPDSSNRSWAYTGKNLFSPAASKICSRRNPKTICKGTEYY